MGIYLNPGNEQFKMVTRSEIYVDKTMLLSLTNNRICTMDKYMAVSRPRRFGKTITMDMLCAYYSRGCDSHALFAPYQIAAEKSFEKHLNQYNVIQVNMRDFVSRTSSMQETLETLAKELMFEILDEFSDVRYFNSKDLLRSLLDVYRSTKIPFVFLIDEWDTVFRIKEISANEQILYLDFLRMILKDKAYVALAYITGILPIKKYGEHSALNMFTEYSMTNQRELAEATGFTEEEVRELCKKYSMPYDETKRWYDGYQLKEISVYNPRSVVMSMTGHDFDSYWTKTETYTALKDYIEMNFDGLQDTVINLMSGNKTVVDTHSFVNDMVTFAAKDDVLTLLIHLGYLTYDFYTSEVWIPNQEVMGEFNGMLELDNGSELSQYNYKYSIYENIRTRSDRFDISYSSRFARYFKGYLTLSRSHKRYMEPFYLDPADTLAGTPEGTFTTAELKLRFAYGEKFLSTPQGTHSLGTLYPIVWVAYQHCFANLLGSEHQYERFKLEVSKNFYTKYSGFSKVILQAGYATETCPVMETFNILGTHDRFGLYSPGSFSAMRLDEFFCDRFVALYLSHNFNGMLWKTNSQWFKPELSLVTNIGWGDMPRAADCPDKNFKTMDKGYFESGIVVDGILSVSFTKIGAGVFYRYGPYSLPKVWDNFAWKWCAIIDL